MRWRPEGSGHKSEEHAGSTSGATPRTRVLVVDDDVAIGDSLALLLDFWGYDTRVVYDAEAALETGPVYCPRIVLIDISLPRMDGYQLARCLREEPGGQELVLIAMTGHSDDAHRCRSVQAGLNYHLVKPVDPDELQKLLAALSATAEGIG